MKKKDPESLTLPEICMQLHMVFSGAADPWPEDDITETVAYVRKRIASWKPSQLPSSARFESTVYSMALAVLAEYSERTRLP